MGESKRKQTKQRETLITCAGVQTVAGRMPIRWESGSAATTMGAYFIEFLTLTGLWMRWLTSCSLRYLSHNAPSKTDVLGTWMLTVLAGIPCIFHFWVANMRFVYASILLLLALPVFAFESTMEISREELQQQVNRMFPVASELLLVRAVMSDPIVGLHPKRNRLSLGITVKVFVDGAMLGKGQGETEGRLSYVQGKGEFYLRDATLTKLDIDNLAPELLPVVKQVMSDVVAELLNQQPIFVLDESDLRQKFMKRRLISVEVREGKLIATYDM